MGITGPTFGHIASLPPHCRPKKQLAFALSNHYEHMRVNVLPNGDVLWAGGSLQHKWTSLSGITFSMSPHHRHFRLLNGWMSFDEKKYPYANFVVENRMCVLGGFIFAGKFDAIGVLPPDCRPNFLKVFNALTGTELDQLARVNVYPDGRIMWTGGQQEDAFLSLNGIIFTTQKYTPPQN